MSLAILFHFLCAQHVSEINISIIRSLRLCRKLLMMDILISETCWANKKWNKIASDIKLVFHSSTFTMMHGPINRFSIKCVLIFSTTFVHNISHSKKNSAEYQNMRTSSGRLPATLVKFPSNLNFLDRFSKNIRIKTSWRFDQCDPSCSMPTGGRTDRQTQRS